MGLCTLISFLFCPRRYHKNNVLERVEDDEINMIVDEFEALYMESSNLVEICIDSD